MAKDVAGWKLSGIRAFLIPDVGSMRVTRPGSLKSIKKAADEELDDMLKKCTAVEIVFVKDRTAIDHKLVRRINA